MDEKTVREAYRFLTHQGRGLTEVRVVDPTRREPPMQIWTNNEENFVNCCREWDGKRQLYVGINPRARRSGSREDIDMITATVLDIDAARPDKKQPATDEELKNAEKVADHIIADFTERGFKAPVKCCSGNGWQLWFAIPPINAAALGRELIEGKLQEFQKRIRAKYENEHVEIDNIGDLPRVVRVIGTKNVKGEPTPERPHRLSHAVGDFVRKEDPLLRDYILSLEPPQPPKFIAQPMKLPNEKVLEIINRSPEIRRYYQRGDPDRSKADFAITCWLAKHGVPAEQIRDVLLSTSWSKIHDVRKIGDPERYFRLTYEHALAAVQDEIEAEKIAKKQFKSAGRKGPKVVESLDVPGLIDIVLTKDGTPAYLLGSEPRLEEQVFGEDVIMIPPKPLWAAPTEEALEHIDEEDFDLFEDAENYVYRHADLPDDRQYPVMTAYVFASWVHELFDSLGFLLFLGPFASGKSRCLEVLARLCWRPMFTTSLTEAGIFRSAQIFKPTLLADEMDLTGHDERTRDIIALLNARHRRGLGVIRVNPEKTDLESIERYEVFGPTAIASTKDLVPALKSRCLVFGMLEKTRPVRKRIDESKAQELRDRLLAFRIRHVNDPKDEPHAELDFLESGRLNELFSPLVRVAKICAKPILQAMTVRTELGWPCIWKPEAFVCKAIIGRAPESPVISRGGRWWRLIA